MSHLSRNQQSPLADHAADELDAIVQQFLCDFRKGRVPNLDQFTRQNPEHAEALRDLLPALVALESCTPTSGIDQPEKIGEYQIVRELGAGGMGVVYLGVHPRLQRMAAIKMLPPQRASRTEAIQRFEREIRAAAQLQHPNIVPVFEVAPVESEAHGRPSALRYYAMQYIDGSDLSELISAHRLPGQIAQAETKRGNSSATASEVTSRRPRNTVPDLSVGLPSARWASIARIGGDVADALSHAHQNDVLHRDIKPSNLILDRDGRVWITDLGLAKIYGDDTTTAEGVVGTLRFMAPERFDGWADPRSDVYSLGMTLYELATLRPAFEESERSELILKILHSNFPSPREVESAIPADLETIILTATSREPADRYPSAEAMRDDLRRFCEKKPITARRVTVVDRLKKWIQRNPIVAGLTAMLAGVLLFIAIGSTMAASRFNSLATELAAEKDTATRSLLTSYENEAQARTTSGRPGQRIEALKTIRKALDILPSTPHNADDIMKLRNETIAALVLSDVDLDREFPAELVLSKSSPDHAYFAGADKSSVFHLHDTATGKRLWSRPVRMERLGDKIVPIFSQDERFVVVFSTSAERQLLIETQTGKDLLEFESNAYASFAPVAFSQDSRQLAVCDNANPIRIYDLDNISKRPKTVAPPFPVSNVLFRGDQLLGYDWDRNRGKLLTHNLASGATQVIETTLENATCWRPVKGGFLIGSTNGETDLIQWPAPFRHLARIRGPGFCDYLDANETTGLFFRHFWGLPSQLCELDNFELVFDDFGHWPTFNSDGTAFSISQDTKVRFFKVHSRNEFFRSVGTTRSIVDHGPHLGPSGDFLVGATGEELLLWSSSALRVVAAIKNDCLNARLMSNREILCISGNELVQLRFTSDAGEIVMREKTKLGEVAGDASIRTASASGHVAWRAPDGTIKAGKMDAISDAIAIRPRPSRFPPHFGLSPDGKVLAMSDGSIRLFSTESGELIHDFGEPTSGHPRSYFQFSHDGKHLMCNTAYEQLLLDIEARTLKQSFYSRTYMGGADWSPDGSILARAADSESVLLHETESYKPLARLRLSRRGGIRTLRFGPNGRFLYARFHDSNDQLDTEILRWDLHSIRRELANLGLDW